MAPEIRRSAVVTQLKSGAQLDLGARAELQFCDALENAANELPEFCIGKYLRFASVLRMARDKRQAPELAERLARLQIDAEVRSALAGALRTINTEEQEDADIAVELADALDDVTAAGAVYNPEALGYLMRQYFECRRRHLAWRRIGFLAPAQQALDAEDFLALTGPLNRAAPELTVFAGDVSS